MSKTCILGEHLSAGKNREFCHPTNSFTINNYPLTSSQCIEIGNVASQRFALIGLRIAFRCTLNIIITDFAYEKI